MYVDAQQISQVINCCSLAGKLDTVSNASKQSSVTSYRHIVAGPCSHMVYFTHNEQVSCELQMMGACKIAVSQTLAHPSTITHTGGGQHTELQLNANLAHHSTASQESPSGQVPWVLNAKAWLCTLLASYSGTTLLTVETGHQQYFSCPPLSQWGSPGALMACNLQPQVI
jgi:hypothetical protein